MYNIYNIHIIYVNTIKLYLYIYTICIYKYNTCIYLQLCTLAVTKKEIFQVGQNPGCPINVDGFFVFYWVPTNIKSINSVIS